MSGHHFYLSGMHSATLFEWTHGLKVTEKLSLDIFPKSFIWPSFPCRIILFSRTYCQKSWILKFLFFFPWRFRAQKLQSSRYISASKLYIIIFSHYFRILYFSCKRFILYPYINVISLHYTNWKQKLDLQNEFTWISVSSAQFQ